MMQWTVNTWNEFRNVWDGVHNFLMAGECVPMAFEFPPLMQIIDEMRRDEEARIGSGVKGQTLLMDNIAEQFRALPVEQAIHSSFSLAHFHLSKFDVPGGFLHGFKEQVLDTWQEALRAAGFSWERCYPIIFISGPQCATNYHMDFSHVLAWQIYGHKRFCGLKSPGRWAPWRTRVNYTPGNFEKPAELSEEDALIYPMKSGDVLWNALLTPHWVEASDEAAMSINISHGGLRLEGRLCPFEQELEMYRETNPDVAPQKTKGTY
jgi:hypothetical protein